MNSHFQFHVSYSSSSSLSDNEDETQNDLMNVVHNFTNKRKAVLNVIAQEQELVAAYIIQQEQRATHRGSIPGHLVIHHDRELIVICSMITLLRIQHIMKQCFEDDSECLGICSFVSLKRQRIMIFISHKEMMVWEARSIDYSKNNRRIANSSICFTRGCH